MKHLIVLCVLWLITGCQEAPDPQASLPSVEKSERVNQHPRADRSKADTSSNTQAKETRATASSPNAKTWKLRTPAEVKRGGNHLKNEKSVYLRQHARNPLEWYPWGEEALNRALEEDKPIFLSIGYSSCHWCHVMEHEVFEKDRVAAFMNEHFVCIKVDREERPDLDTVYMDAVQNMTGRGGWPMSVFLTPSLKPYFGGTYFPEKRFMRLAQEVLDTFKNRRNEAEAKGSELYAAIAAKPALRPGVPLRIEQIRSFTQRAASSSDRQWGGFGGRTKFPTPVRWKLMLHAWRKWGHPEVRRALETTLDQIASGGSNDHIAGGIHRYTVEKTWLIPHFEKMLYDNGQLAELYIEAAAALKKPRYAEVARDTLDWMIKEMHDTGTGLYSSYDADSGGHEGTFYVWTPAELTAIAGPEDGKALALLLGVTKNGNFEGANVLTRRVTPTQVARQTKRPVAEIDALFNRWRETLYQVRSKRVWPGLDKKIVTAWNGLALSGFAKGYSYFGDPRYREVAEQAVAYLRKVHRRADGSLYRASNEGQPVAEGILDDYAFLAVGLLDLYEATADLAHYRWAKELVTFADKHFSDGTHSWFVTREGAEAPLGRKVDPYDAVRPSGASQLLRAHLRIAALAGDPKGFDRVKETLGAWQQQFQRRGLGMAGWSDVALLTLGPYYEVVIAGDSGNPSTESLRKVVHQAQAAWTVAMNVPGAGPSLALKETLPPTFGKRGTDDKARAYVCVMGSCKKPTSDPKELRTQMNEGWLH